MYLGRNYSDRSEVVGSSRRRCANGRRARCNRRRRSRRWRGELGRCHQRASHRSAPLLQLERARALRCPPVRRRGLQFETPSFLSSLGSTAATCRGSLARSGGQRGARSPGRQEPRRGAFADRDALWARRTSCLRTRKRAGGRQDHGLPQLRAAALSRVRGEAPPGTLQRMKPATGLLHPWIRKG